jgi:hypothetical protein
MEGTWIKAYPHKPSAVTKLLDSLAREITMTADRSQEQLKEYLMQNE